MMIAPENTADQPEPKDKIVEEQLMFIATTSPHIDETRWAIIEASKQRKNEDQERPPDEFFNISYITKIKR